MIDNEKIKIEALKYHVARILMFLCIFMYAVGGKVMLNNTSPYLRNKYSQ